jgi:hypothetical protein
VEHETQSHSSIPRALGHLAFVFGLLKLSEWLGWKRDESSTAVPPQSESEAASASLAEPPVVGTRTVERTFQTVIEGQGKTQFRVNAPSRMTVTVRQAPTGTGRGAGSSAGTIATAPDPTSPLAGSTDADKSAPQTTITVTVSSGADTSARTSASGGGGSKKTADSQSADSNPEDNYPAARAHRFFERNAGWFTLLATALLVTILVYASITADSDGCHNSQSTGEQASAQQESGPSTNPADRPPAQSANPTGKSEAASNSGCSKSWHLSDYIPQIAAVGVGIFLLFLILLFTRPLTTRSDIDTIFRFGWYFVVVVGIFGLMFLVMGIDGNGDSDLWAAGKIGGESSVASPTNRSPSSGGALHSGGSPSPSGSPPPGVSAGSLTGTSPNRPSASVNAPPTGTLSLDDFAKKLTRSRYLLSVVRGCDYNSVIYRNPRRLRTVVANSGSTNPNSTAGSGQGKSATSGNQSAAQVLDSMDAHAYQSGMPEGVNCGDLPPQWVIAIGGLILDCDFDGTCPKAKSPPDLINLEKEYRQAQAQLSDAQRLMEQARRASDAKQMLAGMYLNSGERDQLETPSNQHSLNGPTSLEALQRTARKAKADLDSAHRASGLHLNIAGNPIVGGVVVPVFFLAIALMGALVNMARKLPEFQERIEPSYRQEYESKLANSGDVQTPITWEYARDLVVFQIIQVLSAAGIAVLAYSWARPEDQATTVIIAFAAGFSSEMFLLAIRGVVDRVIGLGPRPPRVRAMMTPDTKDEQKPGIPPRGPTSSGGRTSGGFKTNDLVRLVQPVGVVLPGAQGTVIAIAEDGDLIVQTSVDHTGLPLSVRLPPASPTAFELVGAPGARGGSARTGTAAAPGGGGGAAGASGAGGGGGASGAGSTPGPVG